PLYLSHSSPSHDMEIACRQRRVSCQRRDDERRLEGAAAVGVIEQLAGGIVDQAVVGVGCGSTDTEFRSRKIAGQEAGEIGMIQFNRVDAMLEIGDSVGMVLATLGEVECVGAAVAGQEVDPGATIEPIIGGAAFDRVVTCVAKNLTVERA